MASKMMAGLKAKAAEAGKAKQAAKSAMADKMKTAAKDFMAKKPAAPAPYSEASRQANMKANPGAPAGAGMFNKSAPPRPMGGAMGSRAGMAPQVKQGLQGMANKTREAVLQRGKPTLVSGMKKGGKAGKK